MTDFRLSATWLDGETAGDALKRTRGLWEMAVGDEVLTQHVSAWSREVSNAVPVSLYPLCRWFAYNWWRLGHEPRHPRLGHPDYDWRCAHELAAADHGFVWPHVLLVSDGEFMNVWCDTIAMPRQSLNYLGHLPGMQSVPLAQFQMEVARLIAETCERVRGLPDEELTELWTLVQEDMRSPEQARLRQLEALMGYDPEECPSTLVQVALSLAEQMGLSALREVAPVLPQYVGKMSDCWGGGGLTATLQCRLPDVAAAISGMLPWQAGVRTAQRLRQQMGLAEQSVDDRLLFGLLGVTRRQVEESQTQPMPMTLGRSHGEGSYEVFARKRNPVGRRFEWARLLGDALMGETDGESAWLVSSDCASARQRRQRAFAAEFLCPFSPLEEMLDGDYSESARDEAAERFQVSPQVVEATLINHGCLPRLDSVFPY